jgi:hypothetical protein
MVRCAWCKEDGGVLLGVLGCLRWFRCRYCGGDFSRKVRSTFKRREA